MVDLSPEPLSLQETLEAEFCPPLDTTIIALLVADHISGKKPTGEILKTLREQLTELATGAAVDQDDLAEDLRNLLLSAPSPTTEDSRDVDSVFSQSGLEASSYSDSSSSHPHEANSSARLDSALAFLQASFPQMSLDGLKARLDIADFDMERIMEDLLSEEYIKELEERGLQDEALDEEMEQWTFVSRKPRSAARPASSRTSKKRKAKGRTIAIGDVRQKHKNRPEPQSRSTGDPWSSVVSISSYLESLLSRPSSFFQSYFHKPEYSTPAKALRAALRTIADQLKGKPATESKQDETTALLSLMEYIRADPDFGFETLDSEAHAQLCADAELSLVATAGSPDAALDVTRLLHELERDGETTQQMGVYHSPAPVSPLHISTSSQSSLTTRTPTSGGSPPASSISRGSSSTVTQTPPSIVTTQRPPPTPNQNAWQTVPARPKPPDVHPLAAHIPAYNPNNVPRRKGRPIHPSVANPATSAAKSRSLGGYRARIADCHARRDEALRTASRHWNSGGARNRGGEVAFFYAQEAQRHQAEARKLQLGALRQLVDGKRYSGTDSDAIDVHYCTTSEALTIVREVLDEGWVSPARPLRVITGRGSHSSGGIAVLGPAMKKTLEQEGWSVGRWDGGISVRGRTR